MYEMFAGEFPFAQITNEATIWHIGNGIKQRLSDLGCSSSLKSLIDICWSNDPAIRPPFMSIFKELQHTVSAMQVFSVYISIVDCLGHQEAAYIFLYYL